MHTLTAYRHSTETGRLGTYTSLRELLDRRIDELVFPIKPEPLRAAVRHASLGGKRIRPMVTLLSCAAAGADAIDATDEAVAVELLHTSSLIHDDVMDNAYLRRNKPTIHTLYDLPTAILAGDTLVALAYKSLGLTESPQKQAMLNIFTEAFLETCEGQGYDVTATDFLEKKDHILMVKKKTARLIEAAAAIGGLVGGGDTELICALRGFGLNIGMAYQAQDDLLDAVATEAQTGKSTGLDRSNQRRTFVPMSSQFPDMHVGSIVEEYTARAFTHLERLPYTPYRKSLRVLAESLVGRRQ